MSHLDSLRREYAEKVCAGVDLPGLRDAFATVPRERFLGAGPWKLVQPSSPGQEQNERVSGTSTGYRETPDAGVEHLYQDVLVAIDPVRHLNNGQPSAHALWIDAAAPRPGESVLHVGCGTGYFTAIFAELVGRAGQVVAFEVDDTLAERARACLAPWPQVRVEVGDASELDGVYDVIYVNAGTTHARKEWLAALAPGGRLLLPLTVNRARSNAAHGAGIFIRAVRVGTRWPVRIVSSVSIFDCVGARDERAEAQLRKVLESSCRRGPHTLSVEPHAQGEHCLVHVEGFCLQA
jgi:protein-L-isoaspartate(D-aspartate) O-methyltransferase